MTFSTAFFCIIPTPCVLFSTCLSSGERWVDYEQATKWFRSFSFRFFLIARFPLYFFPCTKRCPSVSVSIPKRRKKLAAACVFSFSPSVNLLTVAQFQGSGFIESIASTNRYAVIARKPRRKKVTVLAWFSFRGQKQEEENTVIQHDTGCRCIPFLLVVEWYVAGDIERKSQSQFPQQL